MAPQLVAMLNEQLGDGTVTADQGARPGRAELEEGPALGPRRSRTARHLRLIRGSHDSAAVLHSQGNIGSLYGHLGRRRRIALALPETTEGKTFDNDAWLVHGKTFVWKRPLSKSDLKRWGTHAPPEGPILAAYVEDLDDKDVLVSEDPDVFFTIQHFQGFRAVLVLLDRIDIDALTEVITDAWVCRAPKRLAAATFPQQP